MTWASRVSSALLVVVSLAMCLACLLTVGRSAAAASEVAGRMEQAGARRLSVIDTRENGFINTRTLTMVERISTVASATALGMPFDAVNGTIGPGGERVPVWPVVGEASAVGDIVRGRAPRPGEAAVAASALGKLGLAEPVGYLTSADGLWQYPVVGAFEPRAPFEDLAVGAIVSAPGTEGRELRIVIDDVASAAPTVSAVLTVLAPSDAQGVQVESPTALAQTARDLGAQMSGFGRTLLLLILGAGGFLVAAVVLADVLVRRRDLGRRRTLGITRADLVALVALRTVITALLGAFLGCAAGWGVNAALGALTPVDFTAGIGMLTAVVALLAALPPAAYACRLDPVAVMRTP